MRVIILLSCFWSVFANAQTSHYGLYLNPRFKYGVEYPKILLPQPEAQNGDGRVFKDKNGNIILTVYGCRNEDAEGNVISLEKMFRLELNGGQFKDHLTRIITYSKLGKSFYVISGTENGKIFYQKTIQLQDAFGYVILQYSEKEKGFYSDVSKHIFHSFKQTSPN